MPLRAYWLLIHIAWLGLTLSAAGPTSASPAAKRPVFLYCLHYQAPGENRYPADGSYQEILGRLREHFEVRVSAEKPTARSLQGVSVVLIANPNDRAFRTNPPPPHIDRIDVRTLSRFVDRGGGLIVLGNQEGHNLEVTDFNRLLRDFGLQFTNRYHDAKLIPISPTTPVVGGLHWGYYTGNEILLTDKHRAHPRALATNDPAQPTLTQRRNEPGILLAIAEPGRGRVVLATDAGWITHDALLDVGIGGVVARGQENWEIFRRLASWAAGR